MDKTRSKSKLHFSAVNVMAAMFSMLLVGFFYSYAGAASAVPDIKLNGMDDLTTLATTSTLTATIQMDAGDQTGETADWWIAAETPMGWFYYEYPDGWYLAGDSMDDLAPTYQGPLFTMTEPLEVLRITGLEPGSYTFYFGMDTTVDGFMEGALSYDRITFEMVDVKPVLSYIFPATTYAGASDETLTLLGSNFAEGAIVNFNGVSREATVVSSTHLTAEITAEELADAGTYSVSVTNGGETSDSLDFTLLTVSFGETDIDVPDWTAATHEKLDAEEIITNLDTVFDTAQVQRMDITIDSANWSVMQTNLADLKEQVGESNDFSLMDDPIDVPCDMEYNGKQWYRVGIRFKGNSSLYGANSNKLPFKLNFDKFEDIYPAIKNQRFYGFKKFSLKNNYKDESALRELMAFELYRDFGLKSSHAAFYQLYVDYGSGPVYFGLYTLVEEVDDTVLKTQYDDNDGNLYKPEEDAATFAKGTFDTYEFAKKTNESDLDYSDVQSLYDVLNSDLRVTDPTAWKTDLENILDVPVFLKWFAANNVLQNWDTYGVMPHNYYLYRNPDTQLFEWIPWDNNEALVSDRRCLSLNASEVTSGWPLLRYLLDDSDYAEEYRQNIHEFASSLFNTTRMVPLYDTRAALIEDAVLSESPGYTFTSSRRFSESISALKAHVAAREAVALAY
jgi:spore coat protein H